MSLISSLNVEASLRGIPTNPLARDLLENLILALPRVAQGRYVRSTVLGRDDGEPSWTGHSKLIVTQPGSEFVLRSHHDALVTTLPDTTIRLADERNPQDRLVHYDVVIGDGRNSVTLNHGRSTATSTWGDDHIQSGGGQDTITGGHGRDTVVAGGQSSVTGGLQHDLIYAGQTDKSHDTVAGGVESDIILFHGRNVVFGAGHGDHIQAGSGQDTFYGYAGGSRETLVGGGHTDIYAGHHERIDTKGRDTVHGGNKSDTIYSADGGQLIEGAGGRLLVHVADTANDTIFGGRGQTQVHVAQSSGDIDKTQTTHNLDGSTTIHFLSGQALTLRDVRLTFDDHKHRTFSS